MSFDISSVQAAVVANAKDLNKAVKGGAPRELLPAGVCWLRLVGYIETGAHEYEANVTGKGKVQKCTPHAYLIFEITGPKIKPRVIQKEGEPDRTIPNLLSYKLKNTSLSDKSAYFKLFKQMNEGGTDTHFVQMLGKPFRGKLNHWAPPNGSPMAVIEEVNIPQYEDSETGELKTINPPPPLSPFRVFVWDTPDDKMLKAMWDSIFIDGTYTEGEGDDAKEISLNKWQDLILNAKNFEGSPIQALLATEGQGLGIKERPKLEQAEAVKADAETAQDDDPLNGM